MMLYIWCAKTGSEHNALKSVSGGNYLAAYYFASLDSQIFFVKQIYTMDICEYKKGVKYRGFYSCDSCAFTTQQKDKWDRHLSTLKHKNLFANENLGENGGVKYKEKFHCEKCNYTTQQKDKWNRHLLTAKHKKGESGENGGAKRAKICRFCNQEYSSLQGLMKHQNKCVVHVSELAVFEQNTKLMEENKELTRQIIEICSNMKPSNITNNTNTNTNSNNITNQAFNLNFFLNETCKNAMTLQDFVSSIQLELTDLEETGRVGFCGGISNIIINSLNKLETADRPLHNTDVKRETIYIKTASEWQKDDNKEELTKAIKQIANKNIQNILPWRELHPECSNSSSRKNDQYLKIVGNSMVGGDPTDIKKNIGKVISNIAKEIVVDKQK